METKWSYWWYTLLLSMAIAFLGTVVQNDPMLALGATLTLVTAFSSFFVEGW